MLCGVSFTLTCFAGAELRSWLLFFSLPVLNGIMPHEFLCHLALLVCAIYIYSSQTITNQEFQIAKCLLMEFYQKISTLYGSVQICFYTCMYIHIHIHVGVKATSMNVHMLWHLPKCVKMWGPMWAYSCFHFESLNGYLKCFFHVTKDMSKQVCTFFLPYMYNYVDMSVIDT